MPADSRAGWLVTIGLGLLALLTRLPYLDRAKTLVFDETYYAKDGWTLWKYGYERDWTKEANDLIAQGRVEGITDKASFVVHPPLGKLLIGAGESVFGVTPFGWRIMAVIFGALLVMATVRLARRLSRSTLIGGLAGFLLIVDGLHFVMSRIALLDIFQAFFTVAGIACMVADRDWFRDRLGRYLESAGLADLGGVYGPRLWWRPWRLAAGALFGMACAVKWNSMFPLAVFCVLTLLWDVSARRLAGAGRKAWWGILSDGIPAFCWQVIVAGAVYVASWFRWFATDGGWDRQWGAQNPNDPVVKVLGKAIGGWVHYHQEIYAFHTGDYIKNATHPYDAHPGGWLVMARTIGIDAQNDIAPGTRGCPAGGDKCLAVIDGMGTPLLWWLGVIALVAALSWWLLGRDWRFSVPVLGLCSTWLPWFASADRPVFFFYAIMLIPFTCIALALAAGKLLGPAVPGRRRQVGAVVVGTAVALITANFAFIYPVLTDQVMPRWAWALRMWLASWI